MSTTTTAVALAPEDLAAILNTTVNVEDDVTDCVRVCCIRQSVMSVDFDESRTRLCATHHHEFIDAISRGDGVRWMDAFLPARVRTALPRV